MMPLMTHPRSSQDSCDKKQVKKQRGESSARLRLQWEAHCEEDSMQDGALLIYYNIYQGN